MPPLEKWFSIQVFFLVFREAIETAVIVSVLLTFVKRGFGSENGDAKIYRNLQYQIWAGAALGLLICMLVGGIFIFTFYYFERNLWNATEQVWEAIFSIVASLMITYLGSAMLRIDKMHAKWRVKIARAIIETHKGEGGWGLRYLSRKYAIGLLPMITTLREGLELVVFLGGIGVNQPMSGFPLALIAGLFCGSSVGWALYRGGNTMHLRYFLVASCCLLYLVAAGLFSRGVWFIELHRYIKKVGYDVSENGSGPGSYDLSNTVWHVNCCNGQTDGPWMLFNALLGWQNSATYGSVISYNLYWYFVIGKFWSAMYREKYGYLPLIPRSWQKSDQSKQYRRVGDNGERDDEEALIDEATNLYAAGEDQHRRVSLESMNSSTPLIGAQVTTQGAQGQTRAAAVVSTEQNGQSNAETTRT